MLKMNSKIKNQEIYRRCLNNEDFAYWVGVVQTDGYFKKIFIKSRGRIRYQIVLTVGPKSLPMQAKFKSISQNLFGIKGTFCMYQRKEGFWAYEYKFGCKNLIGIFDKFGLDFSSRLIPPKFVLRSKSLFGAYMAGIIDGDGDLRVSKRKYPQCWVRITGSCEPSILIESIKKIFNFATRNSSST